MPQPKLNGGDIVSTDFCADQFVLSLAPRARIKALSMDAQQPFSAVAQQARGLPQIRLRDDVILAARPKYVVSSFGVGAATRALWQRAGIVVVDVPWVERMADVAPAMQQVAHAIGVTMPHYDPPQFPDKQKSALFLTPSGATTGTGTLADDTLRTAGYQNAHKGKDWGMLDAEQFVMQRYDTIIWARFGMMDAFAFDHHPVVKSALARAPTIAIDGALVSCGGPKVADAITLIGQAARGVGE